MERKEPLAPYPNRAMLTTRKAKWYCCEIEKNLVRKISKARAEQEVNRIPGNINECL